MSEGSRPLLASLTPLTQVADLKLITSSSYHRLQFYDFPPRCAEPNRSSLAPRQSSDKWVSDLNLSTQIASKSFAVIADPVPTTGYLIGDLLPDAELLSVASTPPSANFRMIIFHTDLTDTSKYPTWRATFSWDAAKNGTVIWNSSATDISKRRVHRAVNQLNLPSLQVDDDLAGDTLVIVKSDQNCGGLAESRVFGTCDKPTRVHQIAGLKNYLVCELGDVDKELKQHAQVVIERYVENTNGAFIRAYRAGSRLVLSKSESEDQLKQMGFGKPRTSAFFLRPDADSTSDDLFREAARQAYLVTSELGLHFGAVDLVIDDMGRPYVCDVNATPFWEESEPEIEQYLRGGIMAELG